MREEREGEVRLDCDVKEDEMMRGWGGMNQIIRLSLAPLPTRAHAIFGVVVEIGVKLSSTASSEIE